MNSERRHIGHARNADRKRLMAVMGRVVRFFEEEHAEV